MTVKRWGHETSQQAESLNRAIKPERQEVAFKQSNLLWDYMMVHYYDKKKLAQSLNTPFPPNIMGILRRACTKTQKRHADYISPLYSTTTFRETYNSAIPAILIENLTPDTNCGEPLVKRKRGRPTEKARLCFHEEDVARYPWKCGVCKAKGHDRRNCPTRQADLAGRGDESLILPVNDGTIEEEQEEQDEEEQSGYYVQTHSPDVIDVTNSQSVYELQHSQDPVPIVGVFSQLLASMSSKDK
ncbi:unnamed protein product [Calypogeia fissa]